VSAVWRAARAAVQRRRLQTFIIGVVVFFSTAMIVVALGLVAAASGPFDQAYAQRSGAHLVAEYDSSLVSAATLAKVGQQAGVAAVAGPFGEVTLTVPPGAGPPGELTVVGRADPGGPVDRLNLWSGRWPTGPNEIVLNEAPSDSDRIVGNTITPSGTRPLKVVGLAYSVSESATGWVTPAFMATLHPTELQMLFRFTRAATTAQVVADRTAVSAGLPGGALLGSQSYLALRAQATSGAAIYVPFLTTFGFLSLAVAVLIVVNVVSGAVVSGFRHIGILKSLGFTPTQVMAVYLVMVSVPAVIGTVLGTAVGNLAAQPVLHNAFEDYGGGSDVVASWVDVVAFVGMPALVLLAAVAPALRARSLSAAEAISAGSAQHAGRALAVQRWLSGTRLPRPVSLGLGLPFARPARSAVTLAAIVLGVLSMTLASGLTKSVSAFESARTPSKDRVQVLAMGQLGNQPVVVPTPGSSPPPAATPPRLSDAADEAMLRGLPGAAHVVATVNLDVQVVGETASLNAVFYRGDTGALAPAIEKGHWPNGPGQVAVSGQVLKDRGLRVGDSITLESQGKRARVLVVGDMFSDGGNIQLGSDPQTLAQLAPNTRADSYVVELKSGTDPDAYSAAVQAADPGLDAFPTPGNHSGGARVVDAAATLLTLMLGTVAALGVFNTIVLNTRERRRDLGMLKSIGMTPRQVVAMLLTSMGVLGVLGGLIGVPLGVAAHRLVVPAMIHSGQLEVPGFLLHVFDAPLLSGLGLAAVAIALLGALVPARTAAWRPIAEVLHNE
jgi:putative ABC transport system permease protein